MNLRTYTGQILAELQTTLSQISGEQASQLVEAITTTPRIFVAGAGRSGLAMKGFAMRLMHLGFPVYVVGETITPGISGGDLLLIGSGSGSTGSLGAMANRARATGARIVLISTRADSPIGQVADIVLTIPASTPKAGSSPNPQSIQPMASLFEQSLSLTLDALILMLMSELKVDSEVMFSKHANLE